MACRLDEPGRAPRGVPAMPIGLASTGLRWRAMRAAAGLECRIAPSPRSTPTRAQVSNNGMELDRVGLGRPRGAARAFPLRYQAVAPSGEERTPVAPRPAPRRGGIALLMSHSPRGQVRFGRSRTVGEC